MTYYTIADLTSEENLRLAYFFAKFEEINNYDSPNRTYQDLYMELVNFFNLQNHAKNVLKAMIEEKEKKGVLNPCEKSKFPIYNCNDEMEKYYKEDKVIFDKSGNCSSDTIFDVYFLRATSSKLRACGEDFSNLFKYTFFCPRTDENEKFNIPEDFQFTEKMNEDAKKISRGCFMVKAFSLSDEEGRFLELIYFLNTVEIFCNLLGNNEYFVRADDMNFVWTFYSGCLGETKNYLKNLLSNQNRLISYGLVDKRCEIAPSVIEGIYKGNIDDYFADVLFKDSKDTFYDLKSFDVSDEDSELLLRLLKNPGPANILLYGSIGSGKTEYARTIGKMCGKNIRYYQNNVEVDLHEKNSENFALAKLYSALSIERNDTVMVIDEAESILNTSPSLGLSSVKKGTVNKMLENSVNKVIWIVNYIEPLDNSTKRRFNYSIKFNEMTQEQIKNIARDELEKISIIGKLNEDLVQLCGKYRVTGYSVENILRTLRYADCSDENKVLSEIKNVLEANSALLFGKPKIRENICSCYNPDSLNVSIKPDQLLRMIGNAQKFALKNNREDSGIRILFHGEYGCGKTEMAKYIAQNLSKKIQPFSFLSIMYDQKFPSTLSQALNESEMSGDIILFDNFDTLFETDQRYLNPEVVEEFFNQIQSYKGILICTADLKQIESLRYLQNFDFVVKFQSLDQEGTINLLRSYFAGYTFDENHIEKIAALRNVVPKDFARANDELRFMDSEKIDADLIVEKMIKTVKEKKSEEHEIGFYFT